MSLALDRPAMRPPPEKPEAEASLLGAALMDAAVYGEAIRGRVRPEDLSRAPHQLVLGAIERVAGRGDTVGFGSVQADLAAAGELEAVGGPQFLVGLMQYVPTVAHADSYASIVERTALLRRLIGAANEIARLALTREVARDAVEEAQALLFTVSESTLHRDIVTLDLALRRFIEQIDSRKDDERTGVATGLKTLDAKTGGLQPSDLILVAGRPGLGKTSLALNFVEHAAVSGERTCAVFSIEMSELQLVQRLISMTAGIDGNRIRRGRLSMDELAAISEASGRLQQASIFVEESTRLTVTDVLAKSRRLQAERGLDLVIVDYLQLLEGVGDDDNRVLEVAKISRGLKMVARELQVPMVALSQLSRQIETRGTEPMLSDLRECVTGDARVVDAESGRWVEVRTLQPGMRIVAMDPEQHLKAFELADVWSTGVKPVFRVVSQTGRVIRATANHPFLTARGWAPLESLRPGDVVATARRLPPHEELAPLVGVGGRTGQHLAAMTQVRPRSADQVGDALLRTYADSDLLWEEIRSIEPVGEEEVFDLRVPGAGNFLADGFIVHNSGALEADADIVMFLWQKDQNDRRDNVVRLKLAKHRNGPTADIDLHFEREIARFRDLGETQREM